MTRPFTALTGALVALATLAPSTSAVRRTTPPKRSVTTRPAIAPGVAGPVATRPTLPSVTTAAGSALRREATVADTPASPTRNTTGFAEFVLVAMGDSYGAGEGNPATPSGNRVRSSGDLRLALSGAAGLASIGGGAALGSGAGPLGAVLGAAVGQVVALPAAIATFAGTGDRPVIDGTHRWAEWGGTAVDAANQDVYRCHRSSQSGAAKTARALEAEFQNVVRIRFVSVACSGAKAVNLTTETYKAFAPRGQEGAGDHTGAPLPAQIDQVRALGLPNIDAMYVSAGGNDAGFATVVTECAVLPLPVECHLGDLPSRVQKGGFSTDGKDRFGGVASLAGAYGALDEKIRGLGAQNPALVPQNVYISHYPNPARAGNGTTRCSGIGPGAPLRDDTLGFISADEAAYAETVLLAFNQAITNAVRANAPGAGGRTRGGWRLMRFFGPDDGTPLDPRLDDDFVTHGICSSDPWVNTGRAALALQGPDLLDATNVLDISSSIMHPNDKGFEAYKNRLLPLLRAQINEMIALVPQRPARVRQVAGTRNGQVTIRWDDKAFNESAYVVFRRRLPVGDASSSLWPELPGKRTGAGAGLVALNLGDQFQRVANLPQDAQEFTDRLTASGTWEYLVVACSRFGVCSAAVSPTAGTVARTAELWPTAIATNEEPAQPRNPASVGGSARTELTRPGTIPSTSPNSSLRWTDDPRNGSFAVSILDDPTRSVPSQEFTVRTATVLLGPTGLIDPATNRPVITYPLPPNGAVFVVRGCNLFGCTGATAPVGIVIGDARQEMEVPANASGLPEQPGGPSLPGADGGRPGDPRVTMPVPG